jgi:hypothetical protein
VAVVGGEVRDPQRSLYALPEPPHWRKNQVGEVRDGRLSINTAESDETLRRRGYRGYQWETWSSTDVTITFISDLDGVVACAYTGPGQTPYWITWLRAQWRRWF